MPTPKGDETEEADRAAAEAVGRPAGSEDPDDGQDASPVEQPVPNLESEAADADTDGQLQLFDV
ncbi:hypothetical protein [Streptomyces sp. NBC_00154]|uniref:hypothetical protein n=1 Tax=Streptomyces sp. NBC_00154 TaxID=2975670 RepID=UPI00225163BF|nr:hypothetical protein [Streptomyces sp. NBC_00154]MCX5316190.1 hypothetical protein [Streptomyces sp. NBC_00154]